LPQRGDWDCPLFHNGGEWTVSATTDTRTVVVPNATTYDCITSEVIDSPGRVQEHLAYSPCTFLRQATAMNDRIEGLLSQYDLNGGPTLTYETTYLFSRRSLVRREVIGAVAEGFRINIVVEGGHVRGPALNGTCGHGADWFVVRRDGVGIVDSRVTLHTDDGAIVDSFYSGVVDLGVDAFDRLTKGETIKPGAIHIAARFQTSAPKYAWLNRIQAFGIGRSDPTGNLWDTYALG
jgi:Protein of unknown function (DUF3237)